MIILDENIPESQRQLLRSWRIKVHQIGHEIGRQGMKWRNWWEKLGTGSYFLNQKGHELAVRLDNMKKYFEVELGNEVFSLLFCFQGGRFVLIKRWRKI